MQEAGDIMKTFLGQSSPEHQEVFEYLQGEKRWLSSQEVEAYTFLAKEFDASGQYSTETRFVDEFDRYEIPMQNSRVLSLEDLEVASKVLIDERKRIYVGGQLVKFGSIISRDGFNEEILEEIVNLFDIMIKELEIDFTTANDILKWYLERKEKPQGLQTFIDPIDTNIGGLTEGSVTTIFGYTGHFKSTFALNLLYNNVYHLGYNVAFISLEMTKKDIEFNLTSRHSYTYAHEHGGKAIPAKKIRESSLSDEEQELLETVSEHRVENQRGSYYILDEEDFRGLSFHEITEKLHALDKEMVGGLHAVIVDHVNLLKFGAKKDPYETIVYSDGFDHSVRGYPTSHSILVRPLRVPSCVTLGVSQ